MSSETSRRRWLWLVALVVFAAGAYWLRAMLGGRPTSAAQSAKLNASPTAQVFVAISFSMMPYAVCIICLACSTPNESFCPVGRSLSPTTFCI